MKNKKLFFGILSSVIGASSLPLFLSAKCKNQNQEEKIIIPQENDKPHQPSDPQKPGNPSDPQKPGNPSDPQNPGNPSDPQTPLTTKITLANGLDLATVKNWVEESKKGKQSTKTFVYSYKEHKIVCFMNGKINWRDTSNQKDFLILSEALKQEIGQKQLVNHEKPTFKDKQGNNKLSAIINVDLNGNKLIVKYKLALYKGAQVDNEVYTVEIEVK